MSICGDCPWPFEIQHNPEKFEEKIKWKSISREGECLRMCTFEDAAYAASEAYDLCFSRLEKMNTLAEERLIEINKLKERLRKYEEVE